jgi:uncharacterized membrane protein YdjX (TVP38/TMEM64 family)
VTARVSGHARLRIGLLVGWAFVAGALLYAFLSHRDALQTGLAHTAASSLIGASAAYLALGCLRGFTLIPSTTLVLAALPFFPPWPLFVLTLAGIVISSWVHLRIRRRAASRGSLQRPRDRTLATRP